MRIPRRSPLFSAVVLAGASLTSAGACGSGDDAPGSTDASTSGAETGAAKDGSGAVDTGAAPDTSTGQPMDAACPPDSEIPTPPCALIK
jgi:hypothetical protein